MCVFINIYIILTKDIFICFLREREEGRERNINMKE